MKHTHRGSIVIFALIILAFVLTAALSVATVSLINRRSANISVNSSVAFQNSDKGMEDFLQQLHKELSPDATLTNVASNLAVYTGEEYTCKDGDTSVAATIGTEENNFIITAYGETKYAKEIGQSGWGTTDIGTDTERISERDELQPFESCNTTLSQIDRFKVVGNQNNAVRAVFVKVGGRGDAGLVAHWDFEDLRTINWQYDRSGTDSPGAYVAQDMAGNSPMEICRRKDEKVDIADRVSGLYDNPLKTSDVCPQGDDQNYVGPFFHQDHEGHGAWTWDGIVKEFHHGMRKARPAIAAKFGALPEIQNHLVARVRKDCQSCYYRNDRVNQSCEVNCIPPGDDRLLLSNAITISAWVKWEGKDTGHSTQFHTVVSRWAENKGYRIYVDTGSDGVAPTDDLKACFQINRSIVCEKIEKDKWHHVVGRWTQGGGLSIVVDDNKTLSNLIMRDSIGYASAADDENDIYIGADSNFGKWNDVASDGSARHFFKGSIDDVRIWNREISDTEVKAICERAQCLGGVCGDEVEQTNIEWTNTGSKLTERSLYTPNKVDCL